MNAIAPLALVVGGLAVVGFFVWLNAPRLAFVTGRELLSTLKRGGYKADPVWNERAEDERLRRARFAPLRPSG